MKRSLFEGLKPISPEYASLPILEGFNWSECLADVEEGQWYLVVFRSVRRATADPIKLKMLDDRAYEDAVLGSGLLVYFRGSLTRRRECLSFCLWEAQERAQAATRLESHEAAARVTDEMYDSFELERWVLTKRRESAQLELQSIEADPRWYSRFTSMRPGRSDGSEPVVDSPAPGVLGPGRPRVHGAEAGG